MIKKDKEYETLPPMALEIALEQLKIHMPLMVEYEQLRAQQLRAKYDALTDAGFTPEQALELCKVPS